MINRGFNGLYGLMLVEIKKQEGAQRVITQRERRLALNQSAVRGLAEEAGFNPDLWSDESLWEMMDYFEARKNGEL